MIIIATNNGKNYIENLLSDLENVKTKEKISIIDTQSSDDSYNFLNKIIKKRKFDYIIKLLQTLFRDFDSVVYIINNLISDRFYFSQDSIRMKNKNN